MPDFLPRQDGELARWVSIFARQLTARPQVYHITAEAAAAYQALSDAFNDAYAVICDNDARTPTALVRKDVTRRAVIERTRQMAMVIRGHQDISSADLLALGLRPHKTTHTKRRPPSRAPWVRVVGVDGNIVRLTLSDAESHRRARPANATGATILFAVGETLGAGTRWIFCQHTSKTTFDLALPGTLPFGTRVFVTACWNARTDAASPYSSPIGVRISESPLLAA